MKPSGWVIEPVQKEKKTYSMVTYVIQVNKWANCLLSI